MPIFDLFSKRQRRLRGELPDTYSYDALPQPLRAQIVHILQDALGTLHAYESKTMEAFKGIHDLLCREYGTFSLGPEVRDTGDFQAAVFNFILREQDTERVLDAVEVCFRTVALCHEDYWFARQSHPSLGPADATAELNQRFREHAVGYQFESGQIIRLDSDVLHQEVVRPALHFLAAKRFTGPNAEFLSAHEHYRNGRKSECIVDCLKALESTLKVICADRKWHYEPTATVAQLLATVFDHHLLPPFLQSEFASLRATLESGVPTTRNRLAAHGQGPTPVSIPDYLPAYLLHLTAASILLLTKADESGSGA